MKVLVCRVVGRYLLLIPVFVLNLKHRWQKKIDEYLTIYNAQIKFLYILIHTAQFYVIQPTVMFSSNNEKTLNVI